MATSFKTFDSRKDSVVTRNLLHESIPITGSIVSGTYATNNIKTYGHGIFQSVYDYPFLSSSANHIFDLTCGYSATSGLSGAAASQNAKKINIYNQMAQVLVGFDETGSVREFDEDGDLTAGTKIKEAYFVNFARLLSKDEIKKGSFTLELGASSSYADPFTQRITLKDSNATASYKVNSPAGEYGILYVSNSAGVPLNGYTGSTEQVAGLVYYQAGVAVLTASIFSGLLSSSAEINVGTETVAAVLTGSTIDLNCDELRHRVYNITFNNTTELNSTVYFCRVNNTDFNYSSNPTYLSSSKIVVKSNSSDEPVTYVTTVGLYSPDNELLAVAKLSEPLKKTPSTEFTIRVRTDY
jgi:hypothetical protein